MFCIRLNEHISTTNCTPYWTTISTHSYLGRNVGNLNFNLNVGTFGLADPMRITNAFPNGLNNFPVDKQSYKINNVKYKKTNVSLQIQE